MRDFAYCNTLMKILEVFSYDLEPLFYYLKAINKRRTGNDRPYKMYD